MTSVRISPSQCTGYHWLIAGVVALVLALFTVFFFWRSEMGAYTFIRSTPTPSPSPSPTPTPEPGQTILLMGRGGVGHEGGALTDTMIVARILETQRRIVLLSIPRDLWVQIPLSTGVTNWGKINGAYVNGGGVLAKKIASEVTGVSIDTYISLDFSGFEQAIDTIGGIDLIVGRAFTDYEYPIAGKEMMDCTLTATPSAELSEADLISSRKLDAS